MTENVVHRKYRVLVDALEDVWDRISMWRSSDDVKLPNGNSVETELDIKDGQISALFANLAPAETSPAEHMHIAGEYIMYNQRIYKVIDAIQVGDTLAIGTNIERKVIGDISYQLTTPDGANFYFDYKDGKYGFYPNALKSSDQFVPLT